MGGSLGRREATGRGVMIIARESARHLGFDLKGATVAVQGFGNVGSIAARAARTSRARRSSPSPTGRAASTTPKGLDMPGAARARRPSTRPSPASPAAEPLANDRALRARRRHPDPGGAREPDHRRQRRATSRRRWSSKAPTARRRPRRTSHLHERGVFVVPDILANAGGVTTSYFEWVQDRHGYFWSEKEVNERLEVKMCEAFDAVLATAQAVQRRHAHRRLHRGHQPRRRR